MRILSAYDRRLKTGCQWREVTEGQTTPPQKPPGLPQSRRGQTEKGKISMKLQNLIHIVVGSVCIGLLPEARAVTPAPDGGYAAFTTAETNQALNSLTTGAGNTGVGWRALFSDTTASFNTGLGAGALLLNQADSNTAVGDVALLLNTAGTQNTAVGTDALVLNDSGSNNTAVGAFALQNNDDTGAGLANANTAVGVRALFSNTDGDSNNALGYNSLGANETGISNQAMGFSALSSNVDGAANIAIGDSAALNNVSGSFNTVIGSLAGQDLTDGGDNIYIGATAGNGAGNEDGTIRIGDPEFISTCYIAGISGQTASAGVAVFIDANGKLGTVTSSARFKDDIKPMNKASETLLALKPVTFHYKKEIDPTRTSQFGLVAEEVEKVDPDLVVRDRKGDIYTVRYDAVNAMLLNEFLKEHKKTEKLEATVASLIATVKEQAEQIQKVSAQLALSSPAPQTAENNR